MLLSSTLHCLSHRRPYYMPYLASRNHSLSALNFNANMLGWPTYSSACFWHHIVFSVCACCFCNFFFGGGTNIKICLRRSPTVLPTQCDPWAAPAGCGKKGRGASRSLGPGWVGEKHRAELGGSCDAPSPDPRSGAGIKVACFMWLAQDFEVPESPTALTSSSSLVS